MRRLSLAYFGTPYFSARFLEKLLNDTTINQLIEVKLVVTQPDKPVGRKQILTPTSVKTTALKCDLERLEIGNLKLNENLKLKIRNLDLVLLFAFGQIIPRQLLTLPKYGFWNIHPSLLPKYRGPSPIAYPLILGEKKTGVTIIQMDEKIDHGPIIAQEELAISTADGRPDLETKLTDLGYQMFKDLIYNLSAAAFNLSLSPQNHQQATFTRLLKKEDGFIPLSTFIKSLKNEPLIFEELPKILQEIRNLKLKIKNSPKIIFDYFRGLSPWPGLWTTINIKRQKKRLKITNLSISNQRLTINSVQLEGKKEVDFETFNQAYRIF